MDIFVFSIVFYILAAAVFHLIGHDAPALICAEGAIGFFIMLLFYKSEK